VRVVYNKRESKQVYLLKYKTHDESMMTK